MKEKNIGFNCAMENNRIYKMKLNILKNKKNKSSKSIKNNSNNREIRVFISSTFRDMQEERDVLVKKIFPEIRHYCRQRGVEFVEVDLRWGITEEQAKQGYVLPICLAEIERCRPYFIGILGERYGWIPEHIDEEIAVEQLGIKEPVNRSVTELEILYGVLKNPDIANHAFFYFRDPKYIKTIPADRRNDFICESPESESKLQNLKNKIIKSGFPLKMNYTDSVALGKLVEEDLKKAIDIEYPRDSERSALDREAEGHEVFGNSRTKVYIGKKKYFERLDEHVIDTHSFLIVKGESGSGKSALLANWVKHFREKHPDDFILVHYIGSTSDSSDYSKLLYRVMGEIKRRYNITDEIPTQTNEIVKAVPEWLAKAASYGKLILILDALNQLDDRDNAPDLAWMPGYFHPNIRIIVSTLPGRSLTALKEYNWPEMVVEPLSKLEIKKIIIEYLAKYRKKPSDSQLQQMLHSDHTNNPLFLRVLLNELRVFGKYDDLDNQLKEYLKATSIPELFNKVLDRFEKDYDKYRPHLVRDALSLIWASRRGLSESELLMILSENDTPLPRAIWSPLFLAMEDDLTNHAGLLNFNHAFLRKAVRHRYLSVDHKKQKSHSAIAEYFSMQLISDRKAEELPWQYSQMKAFEELKNTIIDLEIFQMLSTKDKKYELLGYWQTIDSLYNMVHSYNESISKLEQKGIVEKDFADVLNDVGVFFEMAGRYDGAEQLFRRALKIFCNSAGPEHTKAATCFSNLAGILSSKSKYREAESLFMKALEIEENTYGPEHSSIATTLNNLAGLYLKKSDYKLAEPIYLRALAIQIKALGQNHVDTARTQNNLAILLNGMGKYEEAELLCRKAIITRKKVLGPEHPDTASSLNNLAAFLKNKGDFKGAERLYREAVKIYRIILGPDHPDISSILNNIAGLHLEMGDLDGAESIFSQSLGINKKIPEPEISDKALNMNNQALILFQKGDYSGAENLLRQALDINIKVLGSQHLETATTLNNLGDVLQKIGNNKEAEDILKQALTIRENNLGLYHASTAQSMNNLAVALQEKGDYKSAESYLQRALEIRDKVLGPEHLDTANTLNNLGHLFLKMGNRTAAGPILKRALLINEKVLGTDHPSVGINLNNLAGLLYENGDYDGAEPLLRRALKIDENKFGQNHPKIAGTLNNLAVLLKNNGDYTAAEPLYRRALEINEKSLGAEHPETGRSLNNLAVLLKKNGDYVGAEKLYKRALDICEKKHGLRHPNTVLTLDNLALLCRAKGDLQGEEQYLKKLLEIKGEMSGHDDPLVKESLNRLVGLLAASGRSEEGKELLQKYRN